MTDPLITDDEKNALLDGMSTGEVEVQSNTGPSYAEVLPFEIGPRSRIKTNSFPRLQSLNRQFAGRVDKPVEQLLNAVSDIEFERVSTMTFSEFLEQSSSLSLVIEFAPKPLNGTALLNLDATAVEMLVETFYGGDSDDLTREVADFFTPGEISVAMLFANAVIAVISEVWRPLDNFSFEIIGSHLSSGVIDSVDSGDTVIASEFTLRVGDKNHSFSVVWPETTVAPLLPVFEGQKRDRDPAQDTRWERSLRARVIDAVVNISSGVGRAEMTLGQVADLVPGDIVYIGNPRKGTLSASNVPILEGRFGVHDGRYAIEATNWLNADSDAATVTN